MTKVYYDCEFYENGRTIDLLSIGLVNDAGETTYVVNGDVDWQAAADGNPWLIEHVFPSLPVAQLHGRWHVDYLDERVKPRDEMRHDVTQFLEYCNRLEDRRNGRPESLDWRNLELWAWYASYDHVALAQLIGGRMIDMPPSVPKYTKDLQQLADDLGHSDLSRKFPQAAGQHDALADARWNRDAHRWLLSQGATPVPA